MWPHGRRADTGVPRLSKIYLDNLTAELWQLVTMSEFVAVQLSGERSGDCLGYGVDTPVCRLSRPLGRSRRLRRPGLPAPMDQWV